MPVATVTSKGQITIPKRIREHLDLKSGDKLGFCVGADGTVHLVPITLAAEDAFGAFGHKARGLVSAAQAKQKVTAAMRRSF